MTNKEQRERWSKYLNAHINKYYPNDYEKGIHWAEIEAMQVAWLAACDYQQEKIDVLIKALAFYADKTNWHQGSMLGDLCEIQVDDWYDLDEEKQKGKYFWYAGRRARQALEKIKELDESEEA